MPSRTQTVGKSRARSRRESHAIPAGISTLRVHVTFEHDPTTITADAIKDRLDDLLTREFNDVEDWNVRWVSELSLMPLFGAAKRTRVSRRPHRRRL